MKTAWYSWVLLLITCTAWAQEKEIEIRRAGSFQLDQENFPGANILTRSATEQVYLVHEGMDVWADKAFFYKKTGKIEISLCVFNNFNKRAARGAMSTLRPYLSKLQNQTKRPINTYINLVNPQKC